MYASASPANISFFLIRLAKKVNYYLIITFSLDYVDRVKGTINPFDHGYQLVLTDKTVLHRSLYFRLAAIHCKNEMLFDLALNSTSTRQS